MDDKDNSIENEIKFSWFDIPKTIWFFAGGYKKKFIFFSVLLFVVFFYELLPAYILSRVIDFFTVYKKGDSLTPFYINVAILGSMHILAGQIRLSSKYALSKIGAMAKTNARIMGFDKLTSFPLSWHTSENTGNKLERVFNGANAMSTWLIVCGNRLFPMIASFFGILVIFLFLEPLFFLFLVIFIILFALIEYHFNGRIKFLSDALNKATEQTSGTFYECCNNMFSIKALGIEEYISPVIAEYEVEAQELQINLTNLGTRKWKAFHNLNGVAISVFLLLICYFVLEGSITVGMIVMYFQYFRKLQTHAGDMAEFSTTVIKLKSDMERMLPIFEEEVSAKRGNKKFPKNWKKISIKNGKFSYRKGQNGINNLNFSFDRNEMIGITGLTGSGKSTLMKIILGLYGLERGEFKIDEDDYYNISENETIGHIAIVPQDTELFNFSLMKNITCFRKVPTSLLTLAIKIAQLEPVIDKLPDGLDTKVGEKGYSLSGGERQRVGIARAICKDAPIILFDEATSSLDSETEKKIMDGLQEAFAGKKTLLIIAHRLATLKNSDRIVVFQDGEVVEEGKFNYLKSDYDSKFGKLLKLQEIKR